MDWMGGLSVVGSSRVDPSGLLGAVHGVVVRVASDAGFEEVYNRSRLISVLTWSTCRP